MPPPSTGTRTARPWMSGRPPEPDRPGEAHDHLVLAGLVEPRHPGARIQPVPVDPPAHQRPSGCSGFAAGRTAARTGWRWPAAHRRPPNSPDARGRAGSWGSPYPVGPGSDLKDFTSRRRPRRSGRSAGPRGDRPGSAGRTRRTRRTSRPRPARGPRRSGRGAPRPAGSASRPATLEGDRRALDVVLVVGIRVPGGLHDAGEVAPQAASLVAMRSRSAFRRAEASSSVLSGGPQPVGWRTSRRGCRSRPGP